MTTMSHLFPPSEVGSLPLACSSPKRKQGNVDVSEKPVLGPTAATANNNENKCRSPAALAYSTRDGLRYYATSRPTLGKCISPEERNAATILIAKGQIDRIDVVRISDKLWSMLLTRRTR